MAIQTSSLIVVAQNYRDDIVRNINRLAVALKLFQPTPGEGPNIAWVAEGSGVTAETYAEGAAAVNFSSDSQTACTLTWARYRGLFEVSGTALAVAANSRTPIGNIQLWARNMTNAAMGVAKLMDTDFYTGAGGNALVGLDSAIGSVSNTYASIDRSQVANAFFRPLVSDSAGAGLTFAQIRSDMASIYTQSGYRPDVALVSPNTYNKIAALYDPQKFYMIRTDIREVILAGRGAVSLEGGPGGLGFDGCVFVEDAFAPDNKIYYLNSLWTRMEYLPANMSNLGGDETAELAMSDSAGTVPLGMEFEVLAKVGDSERAEMKLYPQLAVERPNACGVRINIG